MTSKNGNKQSGKKRKYTQLSRKELRLSKRNEEAIRVLKRLRGKLG